jgi:phosphatidylglycerol:prolipoprotein diacylglycerol transferase
MMKKVLIGLFILLSLGGVFVLVSDKFVLPQVVGLGGFGVRVYGVILAVSVCLAYFVARKRIIAAGYEGVWFERLFFYVVIFGFIGARFYHVISDFELYRENILSGLYVWRGGLGIYGALIGGVIGLVLFLIRNREFTWDKFLKLLDLLFPALLVGQIVGRFGNLFNYELYGYPVGSNFGLFVPEEFRAPKYFMFERFHSLFLYEGVFNLVLLVLLLLLEKKRKMVYGNLFFLSVLGYNSGRFFLEFLRIDSVFIGVLRLNALVSLITVLVLAVVIWRRNYVNEIS